MIAGKNEAYLCGVRVWAKWLAFGNIPRYELYYYKGQHATAGQYYFQSRSNPGKLIAKTMLEIGYSTDFRPFLISSKEYQEFINTIPPYDPMGPVTPYTPRRF